MCEGLFLFSTFSYATQTYAAPDGSVATSTGATQAALGGYAGYGTTGSPYKNYRVNN